MKIRSLQSSAKSAQKVSIIPQSLVKHAHQEVFVLNPVPYNLLHARQTFIAHQLKQVAQHAHQVASALQEAPSVYPSKPLTMHLS